MRRSSSRTGRQNLPSVARGLQAQVLKWQQPTKMNDKKLNLNSNKKMTYHRPKTISYSNFCLV
jgi:hypothetical protein